MAENFKVKAIHNKCFNNLECIFYNKLHIHNIGKSYEIQNADSTIIIWKCSSDIAYEKSHVANIYVVKIFLKMNRLLNISNCSR